MKWVQFVAQLMADPMGRAAGPVPSPHLEVYKPWCLAPPRDVAISALGCGLSPGSSKSFSGDSNELPRWGHGSEKEAV